MVDFCRAIIEPMKIELTHAGIQKVLEIARGIEPLDIEHLHYLITFEELKRELHLKQAENELHNTYFNTNREIILVDDVGVPVGFRTVDK